MPFLTSKLTLHATAPSDVRAKPQKGQRNGRLGASASSSTVSVITNRLLVISSSDLCLERKALLVYLSVIDGIRSSMPNLVAPDHTLAGDGGLGRCRGPTKP